MENGWNFSLIPRTQSVFDTPPGHVVEITNLEGIQNLKLVLRSGVAYDFKKYVTTELAAKHHVRYEGIYNSEKLNALYQVVSIDDKLILKRS